MRTILFYLWAVLCLGVMSGVMMSFGSHMLEAMGFMCVFWACMLMPMLSSK